MKFAINYLLIGSVTFAAPLVPKIFSHALPNTISVNDKNISKSIISASPSLTQNANQSLSSQKEQINISINGLEIADFIKMVSNIMEKNILISTPINGKIAFVSAKPIYKEDLYDLLINILENNGFTLIDGGNGYLNVIRSADATQQNLPISRQTEVPQMTTEVLTLKNNTADSMAGKIKHLVSKGAKIAISKENNSLIISDYPKNIETVKTLIESIDTRDLTTTQYNHVVILKNSDAKALVATLNDVISKKVLKPGDPRASITSDESSNALIITATDEDYNDLKKTIDMLDVEKKQVYVKAKIVEISENKSTEIGMKYGVTGGILNNSNLYTLGTKLTGNPITLDSSASSYFNFTPATITSGIALGASLSFLGTNGAANVLSEPSLLCSNNQESSIYVGKTVSILSGTVASANSSYLPASNYTRQDVGLMLKLKPRVSDDNKVTLNVEAKLEDIEPNSIADRPTTTKREVKTVTIVQNGESVIIGGLIKDKKDTSVVKLPGLGDIPLLGYLFKNEVDSVDKINLVIVLTPYIVDKSTDLATLRSQLEELDKLQNEYIKKILPKKED